MVVLKGIPSILSPELLYALAKMGHGDELVLADANFPASSICACGPKEIRADGLGIPQLLEAILTLLPLDTYVDRPGSLEKMERFNFYERAKRAYAVVATGCVFFCFDLNVAVGVQVQSRKSGVLLVLDLFNSSKSSLCFLLKIMIFF
ncbi:fucose mutarotase isoform X2 [Poeciliopsis prolifica]|uniref:fucose mutarotase isoform X2 n=1 Tax=Poeciliopsis prolifica TaxID=188132 RepID=UPI002413B432|nr:fucose mutarotase isoform X2 [Poeciliopsis prolifica]